MAIDPISAARAYQQAASAAPTAGDGDQIEFADLVRQAVREVSQTTAAAEAQAVSVAGGQGDIVDVVTAIAAAEMQLEAVIAVRDQVIQAYQEILRMPI